MVNRRVVGQFHLPIKNIAQEKNITSADSAIPECSPGAGSKDSQSASMDIIQNTPKATGGKKHMRKCQAKKIAQVDAKGNSVLDARYSQSWCQIPPETSATATTS